MFAGKNANQFGFCQCVMPGITSDYDVAHHGLERLARLGARSGSESKTSPGCARDCTGNVSTRSDRYVAIQSTSACPWRRNSSGDMCRERGSCIARAVFTTKARRARRSDEGKKKIDGAQRCRAHVHVRSRADPAHERDLSFGTRGSVGGCRQDRSCARSGSAGKRSADLTVIPGRRAVVPRRKLPPRRGSGSRSRRTSSTTRDRLHSSFVFASSVLRAFVAPERVPDVSDATPAPRSRCRSARRACDSPRRRSAT